MDATEAVEKLEETIEDLKSDISDLKGELDDAKSEIKDLTEAKELLMDALYQSRQASEEIDTLADKIRGLHDDNKNL